VSESGKDYPSFLLVDEATGFSSFLSTIHNFPLNITYVAGYEMRCNKVQTRIVDMRESGRREGIDLLEYGTERCVRVEDRGKRDNGIEV
jgi:hypothetical protein